MLRSKRKKRKAPSIYTTRSGGVFSWAGSLAIFYVILLALISIPFLVLFLVLFIRTAMDYHIWIILGLLVLLSGAAFLAMRRRKQIRKRLEKQKEGVMEVIREAAGKGHDVNISFLHGLIRLDYRGNNSQGLLLQNPASGRLKALPMSTSVDNANDALLLESENSTEVHPLSVTGELERLSHLLDKGVLTEAEFRTLKALVLDVSEQ